MDQCRLCAAPDWCLDGDCLVETLDIVLGGLLSRNGMCTPRFGLLRLLQDLAGEPNAAAMRFWASKFDCFQQVGNKTPEEFAEEMLRSICNDLASPGKWLGAEILNTLAAILGGSFEVLDTRTDIVAVYGKGDVLGHFCYNGTHYWRPGPQALNFSPGAASTNMQVKAPPPALPQHLMAQAPALLAQQVLHGAQPSAEVVEAMQGTPMKAMPFKAPPPGYEGVAPPLPPPAAVPKQRQAGQLAPAPKPVLPKKAPPKLPFDYHPEMRLQLASDVAKVAAPGQPQQHPQPKPIPDGVAPLPKLAHPPGPYVKAPNPGGLQLKAPPSLAGTSQPEQVQSAQQQLQYKPAPQVPAPVPTQHLADWMVLWSVNGEPYYYHAPSSVVQWECPAILQAAAPTLIGSWAGHVDNVPPDPAVISQWSIRWDLFGTLHYHSNATGQNIWRCPDELRRAAPLQIGRRHIQQGPLVGNEGGAGAAVSQSDIEQGAPGDAQMAWAAFFQYFDGSPALHQYNFAICAQVDALLRFNYFHDPANAVAAYRLIYNGDVAWVRLRRLLRPYIIQCCISHLQTCYWPHIDSLLAHLFGIEHISQVDRDLASQLKMAYDRICPGQRAPFYHKRTRTRAASRRAASGDRGSSTSGSPAWRADPAEADATCPSPSDDSHVEAAQDTAQTDDSGLTSSAAVPVRHRSKRCRRRRSRAASLSVLSNAAPMPDAVPITRLVFLLLEEARSAASGTQGNYTTDASPPITMGATTSAFGTGDVSLDFDASHNPFAQGAGIRYAEDL